MRRIGAAARTMLVTAAATQLGVPVNEVKAVNHEVVHEKTGCKLGYGQVADAASKLAVPKSFTLKDPANFRHIGKGKDIDGFDITTGRAKYGLDTRLDGMLYAVVARPAVYGATVKSFDASEAQKIPGVVKVVTIKELLLPRNSCHWEVLP